MIELLLKIFTGHNSRHLEVYIERKQYLEYLQDVIHCWRDTRMLFPDRTDLLEESRRSERELVKIYNKYRPWWRPRMWAGE